MNSENRLEQIAGMAILLLLVIGCFIVLRPFVSAVLLALILSYSTFPIYAWCERILKGRRGLAATLMTLMVAAVLLVPLVVLGSSLAQQVAVATKLIRGLFSDGPPGPPGWVANIPVVGTQLYEYWQGLSHNTAKLLSELSDSANICFRRENGFSALPPFSVKEPCNWPSPFSSLFSFIATASTGQKDSKTWPIGLAENGRFVCSMLSARPSRVSFMEQ